MKHFVSFVAALNRVLEKVVIFLLAMLTVCVFGQVLSRFFLFSISWIEELVRYTMIWTAILGTAVSLHRASLMNMDIMTKILPRPAVRVIQEAATLISAAFVLVVIYSSISYIKLGIGQSSPTLKIDMCWIYTVIPFGFGVMLLNLVSASFKRWGVAK